LAELEEVLTTSKPTAAYFEKDPLIEGAYHLTLDDQSLSVTFSPTVYDEHPSTVQLITYGNPLLDDLLNKCPDPGSSPGKLVRFSNQDALPACEWYWLDPEKSTFTPVPQLSDLQNYLKDPQDLKHVSEELIQAAETDFQTKAAGIKKKQAEVIRFRALGAYLADRDRAQRILRKASLVELALGRQPNMLDSETYPAAFNEQAVRSLARHGYPWTALIQLAFDQGLIPSENDPFYKQIQNNSRDSLKGRFNQLVEEARKAVKLVKKAKDQLDKESE
jgi:hypothetical protein